MIDQQRWEFTAYDSLFAETGKKHGLDPWLIKGVACQESHLQWLAYRHQRGERRFYRRRIEGVQEWIGHPYYHKPELIAASFGLMQLMYTTALMVGFPWDGPWWDLCDPATNIELGATYLRQLIDRYEADSPAISVYNAGALRIREGKFENQWYVDKVRRYSEICQDAWPSTP